MYVLRVTKIRDSISSEDTVVDLLPHPRGGRFDWETWNGSARRQGEIQSSKLEPREDRGGALAAGHDLRMIVKTSARNCAQIVSGQRKR